MLSDCLHLLLLIFINYYKFIMANFYAPCLALFGTFYRYS